MSREISVHELPSAFEPADLRGGVAVVIDVLRASTTIVHALAAGAQDILPCRTVDEARQTAANLPAGAAVLGGERDGKLIEGFNLDNSPLSYTPETVGGKTVVFTTTNGTQALLRCANAERIFIGAFVNLHAVIDLLASDDRPIHLVCAGTRGEMTDEDVLCAGAMARGLMVSRDAESSERSASQATRLNVSNSANHDDFLEAMRRSRGGRDLLALGYNADIERAATWDVFDLVPEFFPQTGSIQIAHGWRP